jgi:flagellar basal-body rod modification protein FlgD
MTSSEGVSQVTTTSYGRATEKGTKVIKPGSEMDKNAFLRILAAELTNQDPMAAKDSTQYVAQMAQFASMEQMTNLNSTMSLNSANALIGKGVILKTTDVNGEPYTGIVKDVTNNSGSIVLGVEVNNNGKKEIREFDFSEVQTVLQVPDYSLDYLTGSTSLIAAASMIGKRGEFNVKDESDNNLIGIVKGVVKEDGIIKLRVQKEGSTEIKTVTLDTLVKLDMV